MEPKDVVAGQVAAYNARDLDRCIGYYAPEVIVRDGDGKVLMDGVEAVRARYATSMQEHPDLRYEIPNRIALGDWVVDEERVTGYGGARAGEVVRAILLYRVTGGLIREIVILA